MKKILALVLALCLLSVCALAADSKTAGRGTVITGDEATTEEVETIVELEPVSEELLAKFEGGEAPIFVFAEATKAAVDALIGGDSANLKLIELNGISIAEDAEGDVSATLDYDEDFTQFSNVVGIVATEDASLELPYLLTVNEEGNLDITFPAADVAKIQAAANPFIAILAE